MSKAVLKVDSRVRGNDKTRVVIPAEAGIHGQSGVKFSGIGLLTQSLRGNDKLWAVLQQLLI